MSLPPGQQRIDGFPRFGTHLNRPPPAVPADPMLEVTGAVVEPIRIALASAAGASAAGASVAGASPAGASVARLARRELTADFHCVAGWSATGLRWEGVAFATFYREIVEPALVPGPSVTHVAFRGLDGYRSFVLIEDALADDVLLADRLDGRPLDSDHGAPLRLVSPSQYGFISTKHLSSIELHTHPPRERYHHSAEIQFRLQLVKPHRRARVWQEERHRYLPGWVVRPLYHRLIAPIAALSARGSAERERE